MQSLDLASIFKKISREGPFAELPPLKYGQAMESEALSVFFKTFKDTHKKAKAQEHGIFICQDRPFIGGSPDHIFECGCCGKYCSKIKCPFSIRDKPLNHAESELKYLEHNNDNKLTLKRILAYFMQFQIQMGVTGIEKSNCVI